MRYLFSIFSTATILMTVVAFTPVAQAQQVSSRQVAGLMEDVAALRAEVQRLRTEIEDLRAENARILSSANKAKSSGSADAAALASLRVEINNKLDAQRLEIDKSTDAKISKLAAATNAALADFRKQVNAALNSGSTTSAGNSSVQAPATAPKDLPKNAIRYKVKSGDTLSRIASANKSKVSWILYVNDGLNPNRLIVGAEILVPVSE